jgi:FlaA1/EpsC-like NDP-sugar epimerase
MNIGQYIHTYRRILIIFTHAACVIFAYFVAFLLRFDFNLPPEYVASVLKILPVVLFIKIVTFYFFGLYLGLWRYVSLFDIVQIIKGNLLATLIFTSAVFFIQTDYFFPPAVFVLDFIICTILLSGVRVVARMVRERYRSVFTQRSVRTLIIGAGEAGIIVLRESKSNPGMGLKVIGFIDDDLGKQNRVISGVKVLGGISQLSNIVEQHSIEQVILAIPSAKGEVIRKILSFCQIPGLKIQIIPGLHKILSGQLELKPRQVRAEDLLGREVVQIDESVIAKSLKHKKILVTGAGGSIGSELCRQITRFSPAQVIFFDHNENDLYYLEIELKLLFPKVVFKSIIGDIKDVGLLKRVFSKFRPNIVFHAAAHKHVPLMEENPAAAVKNNVIGTRNLIYASNHYGVERFILISTDKAVNPSSIMGSTKRIAEMILQAKAKESKTKFMAVRFGNVIGSAGSIVPLFKKQIEEGGPITITHPDARRYFMSVYEAVQLVLQAGAIGQGGEIFILDMGEQIKIVDLATNLIVLSGLRPEQDIKFRYIGLRKGEKLLEETLLDTEKDKATKYKQIFIAQANSFDLGLLRRKIRDLDSIVNTKDDSEIIKKIKEIIEL